MNRPVKPLLLTVMSLLCAVPFVQCSGVDSAANKKLLEKLGATSVTVFPTLVRGTEQHYDTGSAEAIVQFLKAEKLAEAALAAEQIPVTGEWGMNQSKMYMASAKSVGSYVTQHSLSTDYALMAEYLMGKGEAVGIHCYVVDTQGRLAAGIQLNSHDKDFAAAEPRTPEDCTKVLLAKLKNELKKRQGGNP